MGIDCWVGSSGGVADARSLFGLGVVAATELGDFALTRGASPAAFRRPQIEIKIRMIEATVINFSILLVVYVRGIAFLGESG